MASLALPGHRYDCDARPVDPADNSDKLVEHSKARIYLGPQLYGTGADLIPVTLSFADVNGDQQPDMIIHFQSSRIVFINDQGGFRPLRPEERHSVEQFLQRSGQ